MGEVQPALLLLITMHRSRMIVGMHVEAGALDDGLEHGLNTLQEAYPKMEEGWNCSRARAMSRCRRERRASVCMTSESRPASWDSTCPSCCCNCACLTPQLCTSMAETIHGQMKGLCNASLAGCANFGTIAGSQIELFCERRDAR